MSDWHPPGGGRVRRMHSRPHVVVIDRDPLAVRALCAMLDDAGAMVVGTGRSGDECIRLAAATAPDVVLVDRATPGAAGVELIGAVGALGLDIRVIVMAITWDPAQAVAAIRAGARGCIAKSDLLDFDLALVLEAALHDQLVCSRAMRHAILERLVRAPVAARLRPRDWES